MKLGNRNRTDNLQPPEKGKGVRNRTQNRPTSETNGVRTKQNGLASDQNVLYKNIKVKRKTFGFGGKNYETLNAYRVVPFCGSGELYRPGFSGTILDRRR